LAITLTLLFSVNALAGPVLDRIVKTGELTVGTSHDFPPLHAKAKDGTIIGLDADLANGMAMAMGVKIKIVSMNFYDLLPALETGKVDMVVAGMTMTPERNLKVAFVGPYFISGQSILAKHETVVKMKPFARGSRIEQLTGMVVFSDTAFQIGGVLLCDIAWISCSKKPTKSCFEQGYARQDHRIDDCLS